MSHCLHLIRRFGPIGLALAVVVAVAGTSRHAAEEPAHDPGPADREAGVFRQARLAMGTEFRITAWAPAGKEERAIAAIHAAFDELSRLESLLSSWRVESETSKLNQAAGGAPVAVSQELRRLLERSLHWMERSGGAFDITGGPLFELWEKARNERVLPGHGEVEAVRALTGGEHLHLEDREVALARPGMKLGFGAIGKGFAADAMAAVLEAEGLEHFLLDAGGDLLVKGRKAGSPWRVGIRHPRRGAFLARFEPKADGAIASSGDYERYFTIEGRRYSHIIDPRTGWPARQLTAVTVFAPNATDADALATALFVMKPSEGMQLIESLDGIEALLVDERNQVVTSSGIHRRGDILTLEEH